MVQHIEIIKVASIPASAALHFAGLAVAHWEAVMNEGKIFDSGYFVFEYNSTCDLGTKSIFTNDGWLIRIWLQDVNPANRGAE